jgi:hypothetical protein
VVHVVLDARYHSIWPYGRSSDTATLTRPVQDWLFCSTWAGTCRG